MSGAGFVAICLKAHDRQRSERAFGNSLSRDGPCSRWALCGVLPIGPNVRALEFS
jgi:hypothetical protein